MTRLRCRFAFWPAAKLLGLCLALEWIRVRADFERG